MTVEKQEPNNINENMNNQKFETTEIADGIFLKDEKGGQDGEVTSTTSFHGSTTIQPTIISPIPLDNLPLNIIEQLKQKGVSNAIITSIPPHNPTIAPHLFAYPIPSQSNVLAIDDKKSSSNNNNNKKSEDGAKSKILSPDERRQRRLLRNRLAAKDCRKKKKEYIQHMEETITRLEREQIELRNQVTELKDKIALLPVDSEQGMMNSEDNYKLMKEVEKLNAKLGNHIK